MYYLNAQSGKMQHIFFVAPLLFVPYKLKLMITPKLEEWPSEDHLNGQVRILACSFSAVAALHYNTFRIHEQSDIRQDDPVHTGH